MKKSSILVLIISVVFLSGCATPTPLVIKQPPQVSFSSGAYISQRLPTVQETLSNTLIPGTYFGVAGTTGSSTVGVLFGALGALANKTYIDTENKSRATPLEKVASINLADLIVEKNPSIKISNSSENTGFELIPAANFYFKNENLYWLTCTVTAKAPKVDGKELWSARYAVAVEGIFDAKQPQDVIKAKDSLSECINTSYDLFVDHTSGILGPFETKTLSINSIDGKSVIKEQWLVSTPKLPDRVIVNDIYGVVQFRRSEIKDVQ